MTLVADMLMLVRDPRELLHERLKSSIPPQLLLVGTVLPLVAIRPAAVLLRSIVTGHPIAGMVLGASSIVLQIGCWVSLAISLPALAKQFGATVGERQAWMLATYASAPLWLAGLLYLAPEDPWMIFFWSRLAHALVYMLAIPWLRTLLFIASWVGSLMVFLAIVGV